MGILHRLSHLLKRPLSPLSFPFVQRSISTNPPLLKHQLLTILAVRLHLAARQGK